MQTDTRSANSNTRIPEAILIAGASAISYAVAYAYRAGSASFYGLPPLLLTPTVGGILQAAAAVGAILLAFWWLLNSLWVFLPHRDSAIGHRIRRMIFVVLVTILMSYSALPYKWGWLVLPIVLCFFGFFEFVFPLLTQKNIDGYEQKLAAQEKVDAKANTLMDVAAQKIGHQALVFAFAAYVLINFAYAVGYRAAKEQEDYLVLTDAPEYVVAEMDDDMVVLVAYDPARLTLKKKYDIRRLASQSAWVLQKKHIGKLSGPPKTDDSESEDLCPKCI